MKKFVIISTVLFITQLITCTNPATDELTTRPENLSGYTLAVRKHVTHDGDVGGKICIGDRCSINANDEDWFDSETNYYMSLVDVIRNRNVEVCATPVTGYVFTHWSRNVWVSKEDYCENNANDERCGENGEEDSGDMVEIVERISSRSCINVIMDDDKNVIANFTPTRTLTISSEPSNSSDATFLVTGGSTLERVNARQYTAAIDSTLRVCLSSHSGFVFDNWTGTGSDITEDNEKEECVTIRMTRDKTLTAHFTPAYDLIVNRITNGGGVGGVISIDATAGANPQRPTTFPNMTNHLDNTPVRVCVDSVNNNYRFLGWSGARNTQDLCVDVNMTSHRELTATFARQVTLNFSATTNANRHDQTGGRISVIDANGESVGSRVVFDAGTVLTLCAEVTRNINGDSTYRFDGWSGDLTGTTPGCRQLTMDDNKTVVATFSRPRLRVTRMLEEGGWVEVYQSSNESLLHTYSPGDSTTMTSRHPIPAISVNLCAYAEEGFIFMGWSGAVTSDEECIYGLNMNTNRDVTAHFRIGFTTDGASVSYGELYDSRDGKTYRTVRIRHGDGGPLRTWMAENLNYGTTTGSWCYDNNDANCDIYGRLYSWTAAMASGTSSTAVPSGRRGVCPSGWHLPSRAEWAALTDVFSAYELKSFVGWADGWGNGSNETGFTAVPGGFRSSNNFSNVGVSGNWWTATENNANTTNAWYINMSGEDYDAGSNHIDKSNGFSVRCIMDY